MPTKSVRKIVPTNTNELSKVDIADRDEDGRKIKATYATKAELATAASNAESDSNDNAAEISALKTRMTTAEGDIDDLESAVSSEASARASAVSSEATTRANADTAEATARANADTALGGRIDTEASTRASEDTALGTRITNLANLVDQINEVAHGASRTFALSINQPGTYANGDFGGVEDVVDIWNGVGGNSAKYFKNVYCPEGVVANGAGEYDVVFVPPGLTEQELAEVRRAVGNGVQIVEVRVGDAILIREYNYPDRWVGGFDANNRYVSFYKLETSKVNIETLDGRLTALENTVGNVNGGLVKKTNDLQTAVAGKQATLSWDSVPTANSNNPMKSKDLKTCFDAKQNTLEYDTTPTANSNKVMKSKDLKTCFDNKQDALGVTTSIIGNVTIND